MIAVGAFSVIRAPLFMNGSEQMNTLFLQLSLRMDKGTFSVYHFKWSGFPFYCHFAL